MFDVFPTARLRPSPFFHAIKAEGCTSASIYNRMILPASFGNPDKEYWDLIERCVMWDVGAERQVQLEGPDAAKLAQIISARDLSKMKIGQGKYVPICNHQGVLINDPICLKLRDDLFWFSVADSDIWFWARAIAAERGLNVEVSEPDVSPLAVQGPMAEDVVASICGDWVRDLKYFWFKEAEINGIPVAVQRSGWSKQGGFEIYLRDGERGLELWNIVKEAGQPYGIGNGGPTSPERVESGLVSVGSDTDGKTNPFEAGLGRFVNLDVPDDVIGIQALRRINEEGPARRMVGIRLEGDEPDPFGFHWENIMIGDEKIGSLTNSVFSPRLRKNIGYGLVRADTKLGEQVQIVRSRTHTVNGMVVEMPFI